MSTTPPASLSPAARTMLLRLAALLDDSTTYVDAGELIATPADGDVFDELARARPRLVETELGDVSATVTMTGFGWALVHGWRAEEEPLFCAHCPTCGGPVEVEEERDYCSEECLAEGLEEIHGEYLSERDREDRVAS